MSSAAGKRSSARASAPAASAAASSASASSSSAAAATPRRTSSTSRKRSQRDEDEEEESSSSSEEESEFEPDDDEEEERPKASRRQSAPARGAAAATPTRRAPSRSQSSSAAVAAAASAPSSASRNSASKKRGRKAASAASTTSESEEEGADSDEEEEQDDDSAGDASGVSSSDEDEQQSSSLRKRRRTNEKGGSAAAACASSKDSGSGSAMLKKGRGSKRGGYGHADPGDRPVSSAGDESLLAHFHRLRNLYEAPRHAMLDDVFRADMQDENAAAGAGGGKGKGKGKGKGAAAEESSADGSSSAAAASAADAASAGPTLDPLTGRPLSDFMARFPVSVSQHVMSFVSPVTVARCERVCSRWRGVVQSPLLWKQLMYVFFPLLARAKEAQLRRQDSDVDPSALRPRTAAEEAFFNTPNPEGLTPWASRILEGKATPVFNPHSNEPLGTLIPKERSVDELLRASEGTFDWKRTFVNRLAATCVECRSLCCTVYKLTGTRVCITCAMQHPSGRYDVVNSGTAKGKALLKDSELARLPSVIEWAADGHKAIFLMHAMVLALRDAKYGGPEAFSRIWAARVAAAQQRLDDKRAQGLSNKKRIPIVYRDNVGSTPAKTKGFFLCGRHNLATLFSKGPPQRIYPDASLE